MKKITSTTLLTTAEGKRISLTYSEIDDAGNIVSENKRVNKIVVDSSALGLVDALEQFAQTLIE